MSSGPINFADLHGTAGRSTDQSAGGPKTAALLAAATEPMPDVPLIDVESDGVVLIYGRGEEAIEAGTLLKEHLDVTVMIEPPAAIPPPRLTDFPVIRGRIRTATGHFGGFELTVDDFALLGPSSGNVSSFGLSRDGAMSRCDVILDISGGNPLFTAADLRDGYLRADPNRPAAVLQAVLQARDLVGAFARPRYIDFHSQRCAHSRSKIIGCTRCLDLCPAGAIAPAGDQVRIDPHICAGCGQCAAVCPTGAASYAMPPADALMRKLRAMLLAYREAGGEQAVILIHDDPHGAPLIDALAGFGEGLPANALPLAVNETTQVGLETVVAAFAYGACALRFLLRSRPRHDVNGLRRGIALANTILAGLGFGDGRVSTIETDDPDMLGEALRVIPLLPSAPRPASFLP
ncbi:MAG TPA: 4Fe-4S dicluster domain-containing protein, partial [Xanthobacteraceae bacterium]